MFILFIFSRKINQCKFVRKYSYFFFVLILTNIFMISCDISRLHLIPYLSLTLHLSHRLYSNITSAFPSHSTFLSPSILKSVITSDGTECGVLCRPLFLTSPSPTAQSQTAARQVHGGRRSGP